MTTLDREEITQRLSAIAQGPWAKGVPAARRAVGPLGKFAAVSLAAGKIDLQSIALSTAAKVRDRQLKSTLRPHYLDKHGITDDAEIDVRDALDDALTIPQLYELAVQTGYLPAESVRMPARKIMADLLWSSAARSFVTAYDYVAVPMLASRVGVSGFGSVNPPEPNPRSALRFAGFLAHLRAFYSDQQIVTWTRFLDDYIEEKDEQDNLWSYLRSKQKTAPARLNELLAGCQLFVSSMASAFHVLDDNELGCFGLIHAYWLQKFFGYKFTGRGYVKDLLVWERDDSWAQTMMDSPRLIPTEIPPDVAKVFQHRFRTQVLLLEQTFSAVRSIAASMRAKRNRTWTPMGKTSKQKLSAAFMKPMRPDEELSAIVGSKAMARAEVSRKLWAYIKKNGLQDKANTRNINADANLRAVFGGKSQVSMFEMTRLVNKHLK